MVFRDHFFWNKNKKTWAVANNFYAALWYDSLTNLITKDLKILANLRKVNGYENMAIQQKVYL